MNISDTFVLSAEEEKQLFIRYRQHPTSETLNSIFRHNVRLVASIVSRYPKNPDLFSEGCLGLMEAIRRFDPEKGTKFSTYATFWIRAFVLDFIIHNHRMIRFGTNARQRKLFFQMSRVQQHLLSSGESAESDSVARVLGIDKKEIEKAEMFLGGEVRLDQTVGDDGATYLDRLECGGGDPEQLLSETETNEEMEEFRRSLNPLEQMIFDLRFVRGEKEGWSLRRVGSEVNRSGERVRQIQESIQERMIRWGRRRGRGVEG